MRALHIGPFRLGRPSGHFNALWALACAQADAGHDVSIVRVGKPVAPEHVEIGRQAGVRLLGFPCPRWRGLWKDDGGRLERDDVAAVARGAPVGVRRGLRDRYPTPGVAAVDRELRHPCVPRATTGSVRSRRRQSRQSDQVVT